MSLAQASNETQDQLPLARASFDCNVDVEVTFSRIPERPAVGCIAWLDAFGRGIELIQAGIFSCEPEIVSISRVLASSLGAGVLISRSGASAVIASSTRGCPSCD